MSEDRTKTHQRRRSYADEDRVKDLIDDVYRFSEKRYPALVGTFVWMIRYLARSFSVNVKVILRSGLGRRTFGFFLLFDALFFQKLFMFLTHEGLKSGGQRLWGLVTLDTVTWNKFDESFWYLLTPGEFWGWVRFFGFIDAMSIALFLLFGYLYLATGLWALFDKSRGSLIKRKEFTYSNGKSRLFPDPSKLGISEQSVHMYLEPALVLVVGLLLYAIFETVLGPFLMLCAVALFFDEYIPHYRRREKVLDKLDAEFEMERLQAMMAAYDDAGQGVLAKRVPAELANAKDAERYKAEMGKVGGGRDTAGLT